MARSVHTGSRATHPGRPGPPSGRGRRRLPRRSRTRGQPAPEGETSTWPHGAGGPRAASVSRVVVKAKEVKGRCLEHCLNAVVVIYYRCSQMRHTVGIPQSPALLAGRLPCGLSAAAHGCPPLPAHPHLPGSAGRPSQDPRGSQPTRESHARSHTLPPRLSPQNSPCSAPAPRELRAFQIWRLFSFPKRQEHLGDENEHPTWFANDRSRAVVAAEQASSGSQVSCLSKLAPLLTWPALCRPRPQGRTQILKTQTAADSTGQRRDLQEGSQGATGFQERRAAETDSPQPGVVQAEGKSVHAVPHYHKLCSRVSHMWGNRRGQHSRSAMEEPSPGKSTCLIVVSALPAPC
nr:uncharacterized protein LOC108178639 isoform X2 [Oryctolagus cuniculus]